MEDIKPDVVRAAKQLKILQGENLTLNDCFPIDRGTESILSRFGHCLTLSHDTFLFLGGVAVGCFLVALAWWTTSIETADTIGISLQASDGTNLSNQLGAISLGSTRIQITPYTASEDSNTDIHAKSGVVHRGDIISLPATSGTQPDETDIEDTPWVINLASVSHKANAERFMKQAKSESIEAESYQVTVRGKKFWRVHATGFASAEEARERANSIRKKLGVEDIWIAKR